MIKNLLNFHMPYILRINKSVQVILLSFLSITAVANTVDYDWNALGQGQIIIEHVKDEHNAPGVRAVFLVKAKRDDIWGTLTDYDNYSQIFEGVNRAKLHDESEDGARLELWVDGILTEINFVLYRTYNKPRYKLTWKRVSGDMKDIRGSWQILDTSDPESKLLIYESFVEFGFPVLNWIIRPGAKQKAEKMAYRFREWIEQSETSH